MMLQLLVVADYSVWAIYLAAAADNNGVPKTGDKEIFATAKNTSPHHHEEDFRQQQVLGN